MHTNCCRLPCATPRWLQALVAFCFTPHHRYELHYAEMALSQLLAALEMKHNLAEQMGASQLELRLKHEKMAVLVAECQL